jgi:hypothetical protein
MQCRHCGEDDQGLPLVHMARCDGRQGAIEALEPVPAPVADVRDVPDTPPAVTITRPRVTSVEAFYEATAAGTPATWRQWVYVALSQILEPPTAMETFAYLADRLGLELRYDSNTRARFTELRDLGVIRECAPRRCRVTGRRCLTWAIVPAAEYVGRAVIHRCPTCGQIVARDVPTAPAHAPPA